jgi:hypothetical protein
MKEILGKVRLKIEREGRDGKRRIEERNIRKSKNKNRRREEG